MTNTPIGWSFAQVNTPSVTVVEGGAARSSAILITASGRAIGAGMIGKVALRPLPWLARWGTVGTRSAWTPTAEPERGLTHC